MPYYPPGYLGPDDGGTPDPGTSYWLAPNFASDATWFIPAADLDVIREMAGADISDWPDARIQSVPYLLSVLQMAGRRVPTDWDALDDNDRQYLRLAIDYATAAQILLQVDQGQSEEIRQGRLVIKTSSIKTSSQALTLAPADLQGYSDYYFGLITLPDGVTAIADPDVFVRPMLRTTQLFGVCGRLF